MNIFTHPDPTIKMFEQIFVFLIFLVITMGFCLCWRTEENIKLKKEIELLESINKSLSLLHNE